MSGEGSGILSGRCLQGGPRRGSADRNCQLAHSGVFQGNFARDSWESSHICAEVKADFLTQDSRPAVRREGLLIEDGRVVLVLEFRGRQVGQYIPEVLPRFFRARAAQELLNPLFPGVIPIWTRRTGD